MNILDLLSGHGLTPKQVACTHGGEYASACPECGGNDRFRCWPDQGNQGGTWYCRGCDKGGDCIQFLREFDHMTYHDACRQLGIEVKSAHLSLPKKAGEKKAVTLPQDRDGYRKPSNEWMEHAAKLVVEAKKALQEYPAVLNYLAARGISPEIANKFHLGFIHGESGHDYRCRGRQAWGLPDVRKENGKSKPLWIPEGLIIPAFDNFGNVIRLRVRRTKSSIARFSPDMKYVVIQGSSSLPMMVRPKSKACVVVESELDAIACAAACWESGLDVGALSVLTAMGKPDPDTHEILKKMLRIEVALDFDAPDEKGNRPGARGVAWWKEMYPRAIRWPVPAGKDPGEAVAMGIDLEKWIKEGLPPVFSLSLPEANNESRQTEKNGVRDSSCTENHASSDYVKIQERMTGRVENSSQVKKLISIFQSAGIHINKIRSITKKEFKALSEGAANEKTTSWA